MICTITSNTNICFKNKKAEGTLINKAYIFSIIGFMHPFKGKEMVFKVKTMTLNKNNKGARIDQAAKPEVISKINAILGKEIYTIGIGEKSIGLGVILEMLMRYKTENGEANMFFSPENAILNGVIDA